MIPEKQNRIRAPEALHLRRAFNGAQIVSEATMKKIINGIKVVALRGMRIPDVVKTIAMAVRRDSPENTAFIAATKDPAGKPLLTVALTDDLVKNGLNAAQIARNAAKNIKGGGGGQPGFAQAGGKDAEGLPLAFDALLSAF